MTGPAPIHITKIDHWIAVGVTDDLDLDVRVISNRERVGAGAGLRVAVDDHRLIEADTEVARMRQTISERDGADVRVWVTAGVAVRTARGDVKLD